jgi:protein SCO1/2
VDSTVQYISKYHTIAVFHLPIKTENITQKDYEGKIYVADFSLQRVVLFVQNDNQSIRYSKKAFANNPKLLSFTVFPETDSVPF